MQQKIDQYITLLLEQNKTMNLTAHRTPEAVRMRHFEDSFHVLDALAMDNGQWAGDNQDEGGRATRPVGARLASPAGIKYGCVLETGEASLAPTHASPAPNRPLSLLDVGSGAGFPGLALALADPTLRVTVLDATRKKVNFLQTVIDTLPLPNATALWGRAEDLAHTAAHREQYDIVTARGVAALGVLCELCLPFLCVGGVFLAMKGNTAMDHDAPSDGDGRQMLCDGLRPPIAVSTNPTHPPVPNCPLSIVNCQLPMPPYAYTLSDGREHVILPFRKIKPTLPRFPRSWKEMKA